MESFELATVQDTQHWESAEPRAAGECIQLAFEFTLVLTSLVQGIPKNKVRIIASAPLLHRVV